MRNVNIAFLAFICGAVLALGGCGKGPKSAPVAEKSGRRQVVRVTEVTYDRPNRVMVVTLADGVVYQYEDVPEGVYLEFLAAPERDAYFTAHVSGQFGLRPAPVRIPIPVGRIEPTPVPEAARPEPVRPPERKGGRGRGGH